MLLQRRPMEYRTLDGFAGIEYRRTYGYRDTATGREYRVYVCPNGMAYAAPADRQDCYYRAPLGDNDGRSIFSLLSKVIEA